MHNRPRRPQPSLPSSPASQQNSATVSPIGMTTERDNATWSVLRCRRASDDVVEIADVEDCFVDDICARGARRSCPRRRVNQVLYAEY